jgi:hypothetical protein
MDERLILNKAAGGSSPRGGTYRERWIRNKWFWYQEQGNMVETQTSA